MGHDQQAKFFVHAYQGFLQGTCHALCGLADPAQILNALSEGVSRSELLGSSLLTAVALTFEKSGPANVACAGHPCPYVLTGDIWQKVEVSGPLLGFQEHQEYASHCLELSGPVLLYTDGLNERLKDNEWQQLLNILMEELKQEEPSLARVLDYYDNKADQPVADDMTILVLIPDDWQAS